MTCAYRCHEIGGPYIAENPDCPEHGRRPPTIPMPKVALVQVVRHEGFWRIDVSIKTDRGLISGWKDPEEAAAAARRLIDVIERGSS